MIDLIVVIVILIIIGVAIAYIWKEKKKGRHCIGCPCGGTCEKCSSQSAEEGCSGCNGNCNSNIVRHYPK